MPCESAQTHRIQRHFHPPSARARFSPERLLSQSAASARLRFPIATVTDARVKFDLTGQSKALIPKPKGEASRLSRGGYSVRKTLAWDETRYDDLLVSWQSGLQ